MVALEEAAAAERLPRRGRIPRPSHGKTGPIGTGTMVAKKKTHPPLKKECDFIFAICCWLGGKSGGGRYDEKHGSRAQITLTLILAWGKKKRPPPSK